MSFELCAGDGAESRDSKDQAEMRRSVQGRAVYAQRRKEMPSAGMREVIRAERFMEECGIDYGESRKKTIGRDTGERARDGRKTEKRKWKLKKRT